jgi:membrane dipeptidase
MNIIDMHCDTISAIRQFQKAEWKKDGTEKCCLRKNELQIDLEKMREGGYLLQNFALFVDCQEEENPMEAALEMVDLYYRELEKNNDWIRPAFSYEDILKNKEKGVMTALLTLEEGEICKGSLAYLRNFYRLGVRMMTLTWNYENQIGAPNTYFRRTFTPGAEGEQGKIPHDVSKEDLRFGRPDQKGLTETGLAFLSEMEKLGMIIDVSHLSDGGFYDVYHHTTRPFAASHSNARTLCPHCRNLTDDMIRKMGERGCIIGLNYYGNFLTDQMEEEKIKSTVADVARHARYIADLGGVSCLGLGSDFDGFLGETELSDCSKMPILEQELKKQHFSASEIDRILYGNVLNFYRECL